MGERNDSDIDTDQDDSPTHDPSIDLVVDKLESQIRSVNGARTQRKRHGVKAGQLATSRR